MIFGTKIPILLLENFRPHSVGLSLIQALAPKQLLFQFIHS